MGDSKKSSARRVDDPFAKSRDGGEMLVLRGFVRRDL